MRCISNLTYLTLLALTDTVDHYSVRLLMIVTLALIQYGSNFFDFSEEVTPVPDHGYESY